MPPSDARPRAAPLQHQRPAEWPGLWGVVRHMLWIVAFLAAAAAVPVALSVGSDPITSAESALRSIRGVGIWLLLLAALFLAARAFDALTRRQ